MKGQKALFSSAKTGGKDDWETPLFLFEYLNKYHKFDLDAAANAWNAKCVNYFTEQDNALVQDWSKFKSVWLNPPYSMLYEFVMKAYEESCKTSVVMLIPSRTDTRAFHDFIFNGARSITFIKGRLHFGYSRSPATFPSCIVHMDQEYCDNTTIETLDPKLLPGYAEYRKQCVL